MRPTPSCHKTGEQAFEDRYVLIGDEAIAGRRQANTELAGFLDAGRAHGWQIEHVLSAAALDQHRAFADTLRGATKC